MVESPELYESAILSPLVLFISCGGCGGVRQIVVDPSTEEGSDIPLRIEKSQFRRVFQFLTGVSKIPPADRVRYLAYVHAYHVHGREDGLSINNTGYSAQIQFR